MIFIKPLKLHDKNYRYMQLCNSYDFYSREKIVSPFCHRIIVSSAIFVSYENLYFCLNICKEMSVRPVSANTPNKHIWFSVLSSVSQLSDRCAGVKVLMLVIQ